MEQVIKLLIKNGYQITIVLLIGIILFIISNAANIQLWKSEFWGLFSNFSSFAKKKQLSSKVRGTIQKAVQNQISNENILPSDLKVIWVNEENSESFIQNNQVIVRIKQTSNPNADLVTAVSEYVNNGLLYNVKRYLDKNIVHASRILMIRKIIQDSNKNSLTYLDEKYIIPILHNDSELNELYDDLVKIDRNGMFTDIMLNEFSKAGISIYGEVEDPELVAESKEFMRFLYNIAIRLSTEPSDLCFNRDYFKIAIFLAASDRTLSKKGINPFINAITNSISNGIQTIYVFGLGLKREIAEQITKEAGNDYRIQSIRKHTYKHVNEDGRRIPGVFYECEIYKDTN